MKTIKSKQWYQRQMRALEHVLAQLRNQYTVGCIDIVLNNRVFKIQNQLAELTEEFYLYY